MVLGRNRRVGFVDWNSEEERERSARGVAFRAKRKQRKVAQRNNRNALQDERAWEGAHRTRIIAATWTALTDAGNEGRIGDLVRDLNRGGGRRPPILFQLLRNLHEWFRASPFWGRLRVHAHQQRAYDTRDMIHNLRRMNVSLAEIQRLTVNAVDREEVETILFAIGGNETFANTFIPPPPAPPPPPILSSSEGEEENAVVAGQRRDAPDNNNAGNAADQGPPAPDNNAGNPAGRRRRRAPRNDDDPDDERAAARRRTG